MESSPAGLENFVVHLIREGHWREAVYLLREEQGLSVAQAELDVEQLALKYGVHRFSRQFFIALIAGCGISLVVLAGIVEMLSR
jgi:hypothetical protein